jgi:hypothetical protein
MVGFFFICTIKNYLKEKKVPRQMLFMPRYSSNLWIFIRKCYTSSECHIFFTKDQHWHRLSDLSFFRYHFACSKKYIRLFARHFLSVVFSLRSLSKTHYIAVFVISRPKILGVKMRASKSSFLFSRFILCYLVANALNIMKKHQHN